ncbi:MULTISPECIES: M48 family metallopeptidase [unclassified Bradyrhizobium]|uniref:tetratricopeptide repeat protein n=1 Tax=unclassified Bradyrhizobium TaxID=2631580 RepID=UPI0020B37B45|nr:MULTISPECIES: histidine kinase [unclassified Bradyrhizobium]MCP3380145.1 histidine kinase [Bradyrhizobium sp. CCGUVB4N]MCP3441006.1 histidine kinase [Bradyrhizobium sp. CCGUVB14]
MSNSDGAQRTTDVSNSDNVSLSSGQERDLLCALSYLHLACGQSAECLALLRLIVRDDTQDVDLLRILAYALISEGLGDEALPILDKLDALDDGSSSRISLMLLRSQALRRAGLMDEARAVFQTYVSLRDNTGPINQRSEGPHG